MVNALLFEGKKLLKHALDCWYNFA